MPPGVPPAGDAGDTVAVSRFGDKAPTHVCEIRVVAGTDPLLLEPARDRAAGAFGLIRQQNLFGFPAKIYLDQVT